MDIRLRTTLFVDYLKAQELTTISPVALKFAFIEWWGKTDITKLIIDFLIVTKVLIPINNEKKADYTINYKRNEQLKNPDFKWLKTDVPQEPITEGA